MITRLPFLALLFICIQNPSNAQGVEKDAEGFETFSYEDGDTTWTMKKYFFCMLSAGDSEEPDDQVRMAIQQGHLSHLSSLGKKKKICMVGPFGEHPEFEGIVVFNTTTREEAEELMQADPAVRAGSLKYEIVEWWAAKGSELF